MKLKISTIIHLFAVAHVILTLFCRSIAVDDTLLLTLLTMMMTIIICIKKGITIELAAVSIILANVCGYFLGMAGAWFFGIFVDSAMLKHALATFITTEILGWSIILFTRIFRPASEQSDWTHSFKWILLACVLVIIVRFGYIEVFSHWYDSPKEIYAVAGQFLSNAPVILILLCANLIYIRLSHRSYDRLHGYFRKMLSWFCVFFLLPLPIALLIGYNLPFEINRNFSADRYIPYYMISLLFEVIFYSLIFMIDYAIRAKSILNEQKNRAEKVEYQYFRIKQQLNPHFLFNSLNVLDGIVGEGNAQQASEYIHKLAGLYRYLLTNEKENLVRLEQEIIFVGQYEDLLKVRFPKGFDVVMDIRDADLKRYVVPCSLQLLIENAVRHNAVGGDNDLIIRVKSDGENIEVKNNLCPKMTAVTSTGVGHKYIRQEYLRRSDKEIQILKTDKEYTIILPLL